MPYNEKQRRGKNRGKENQQNVLSALVDLKLVTPLDAKNFGLESPMPHLPANKKGIEKPDTEKPGAQTTLPKTKEMP